MNKYIKLLKNIGLIGLGNFASRFLGFLLIPLYTACLSTTEYGIADTLTIIVTLSVPTFCVMIYDGVMRYALDKKLDKSDIFSASMYVTIIGSFVFFIATLLLYSLEIISEYFIELIIYFLAWAFYQVTNYFCRGLEKIGVFTLGGVIATAIAITLNIIFLLILDFGVTGFILAYAISYICSMVYMVVAIKAWKYIKKPNKIDKQLRKEMLTYSFPLVLNYLSMSAINYANRYVVIAVMGFSFAGIFGIANKISIVLVTIGIVFISAWRISAVEDFGSKNSKEFYSKVFEIYSTFCFCVAGGLILFSKVLGYILYSNDFFIAWKYSTILILGACIYKLADFMITIYTSSKKTKKVFVVSFTGALVSIISSVPLVYMLELYGAAIAVLLGYCTVFIFCIIDTRKIMKFNINFKSLIFVFLILIVEIVIVLQDKLELFIVAFFVYLLIPVIKRKGIFLMLDFFKNKITNKSRKN